MAEVADARHGRPLAQDHSTLARAGDHRAKVCRTEPGADAGLLVNVLRFASLNRDLLADFLHEVRNFHRVSSLEVEAAFLVHNLNPQFTLPRVVGLNQRTDSVFQLGNHLAAAVVGRRVGGEQNQHIDVKLDRIAANLHVPFLEDVEQTDLDQFIENLESKYDVTNTQTYYIIDELKREGFMTDLVAQQYAPEDAEEPDERTEVLR